ncbi:hypothetical protein F2P56_001208 [Juglans regia]|uniref:Ankyrin repeat-containing protein ITN1-like n=2 Tax=Juglans regia TaxID=51240 RepID=A0A2I4HPM9_JUGRE|nr:ankyrin repeat-containing protein ITN1-like [Juglans regia]KAF5480459.1 hypothetical protein F2P56_001208 [Juglans regia]
MDTSHGKADNTVALYEASFDGCVSTLNTLVQRDRLILHKISLTSFTETPLHIAALLGHLHFTNALLSRKPKLAEKVDSLGRTALHLACAEGHTQVVKALLQANADICLVPDQEERIPLHLAAMRGHIDVIKELLTAQPQTIFLVNLDGYNILHLCVQYNSLDALKLLVESSTNDDFVNSKDDDGNSILHLATMLGQTKTIKYLLSIPEIKRKANDMNRIGNTALDVSEAGCHGDFKCHKIQDILKAAGVKRSKDLNSPPLPTLVLPSETHEPTQSFTGEQSAQSRFRKWWSYFYLCVWAKHLQYQGNWVDETRGTLMLVATVIATMTFQAGINPPGGVWQQDTTNGTFGCNSSMCAAGTAILSYSETYIYFLSFNTTSFVAALTVVLLVTSGFPLRSKGFIWFLTLTMFIAIYSVVVAYIRAVKLVNPTYFQDYSLITIVLPGIWLVLQQVLGVIHVIRFLFWMIRKLFKFLRRCRLTKRPANDAINV